MSEDKLRKGYEDEGDFRWMRAILQMLESVLGSDYGHSDVVASMYIVLNYRIVLAEGMVLNKDDDLNRQVWLSDAAFVASQLAADSGHSEAWWKGEYGIYPTDTHAFESLVGQLALKIVQSPLVVSCERI